MIALRFASESTGLLYDIREKFENLNKTLQGSFEYFILGRFLLVLALQIFAYFFLSLFKSGLTEVRFYQNEIMVMQAKYGAFQAAMLSKKPEAMDRFEASMIELDRNQGDNKHSKKAKSAENPGNDAILSTLADQNKALMDMISKVVKK